jgi:beta-lactamase class A
VIKKQFFYLAILFSALGGGILSYFLFHRSAEPPAANPAADTGTKSNACLPAVFRMHNFKYTEPLLCADRNCESPRFASIKSAVNQLNNSFKTSGDIASSSVYLRDLENGDWMNYNEYQTFHPASLLKVPLMIAILRTAEKQPGYLDKAYLFDPPKDLVLPKQNYISKSLEPGKKYTIKELLTYMVSYSDNKANWLLQDKMEPDIYENLLVDSGLGLPTPEQQSDGGQQVTSRAYSNFMRILFNSSYLSPEYSDLALSMMAGCDFNDGMLKGLPEGIKIAHKFGEWDNHKEYELHESGIIYHDHKAYLITIMTKGDSRDKLPKVVSAMTKMMYEKLSAP